MVGLRQSCMLYLCNDVGKALSAESRLNLSELMADAADVWRPCKSPA
jgi:hypothetical protein